MTTKNGTPKTPNRKPTFLQFADGREEKSELAGLADELRGVVAGEKMPHLEALKERGVKAVRVGRQRKWTDIDRDLHGPSVG